VAGHPQDTSTIGRFLTAFGDFLLKNLFYVVPKPFDTMIVGEVLLPLNTNVWLDQRSKLPRRRAWAVLNTDPTLGNNLWVSTREMTAAAQGGRVLAQGGSLSLPGSDKMDIHAFTNVVAGVTVSFYQFA